MNNKRPGEGLHIVWEILVKGIQYRLRQWHEYRCRKGKHDWEEQEESTLETKCR